MPDGGPEVSMDGSSDREKDKRRTGGPSAGQDTGTGGHERGAESPVSVDTAAHEINPGDSGTAPPSPRELDRGA